MADNTTQLATELRETAQKIEVGDYDWGRDASLLRQAAYVIDNQIPALDILQSKLDSGAELRREDARIALYKPSGEYIIGGKTVMDLMVNLALSE